MSDMRSTLSGAYNGEVISVDVSGDINDRFRKARLRYEVTTGQLLWMIRHLTSDPLCSISKRLMESDIKEYLDLHERRSVIMGR